MTREYVRRFLSSEVPSRSAEQCLYHVIPVPYEASVSYGEGTANGPEAILAASDQLELILSDGRAPENEEYSRMFRSNATENLKRLWSAFRLLRPVFLIWEVFPYFSAESIL